MADPSRPTALRSITFHGLEPGPRLIVLGAVHGNETCGTQAAERVHAELEARERDLLRGSLTLVPRTNPLAYDLGQRMGERNLNRNLRVTEDPQDFEDRIANVLCPLLAAHDVLLDLHSFHTGGQPFIMLGPRNNEGPLEGFAQAREEEALAACLGPRRMVEGWLDTYARGVAARMKNPNASHRAQILSTDPSYGVGTTEYMRSQGGYGVTLECGQHDDPQAPVVAYNAIINTLAHLGMLPESATPGQDDPEVLRLVEVIDRDHPDDRFACEWKSFDPLEAGDLIGVRADGTEVRAPEPGFIVFPNPNSLPGNEWFYRAEFSDRRVI
ncbi:M14 family metallopeptidase [Thioalkalivibrio sp. ALE28]|uniref:M14 family metallopeptidase n=1 Tax=Thioalkalivibrio sp. ALE28 TaxID=1158179 RepID=UPI00037D3F54|nr:M14 family metallopeptidase [Thioalkalivibrio sp. ALE28]